MQDLGTDFLDVGLPGGPGLRLCPSLQGARVGSLVRELRSCMPHMARPKKKKKREREIRGTIDKLDFIRIKNFCSVKDC